MRWTDLPVEPGLLEALQYAGEQPIAGNQNEKRRWSEKFANACAVAAANSLRQASIGGRTVLPESIEGGTEPLTPLGSVTRKRIDVTVVDPVLGLEIGLSLKGLNFKDANSGNYDKNLTGRLYELGDEVRLVHEHLPHAYMVGLFFLPLAATNDKQTGNSSFANAVLKLRNRTGRLDPALAAHAPKCDGGYVALYSLGDEMPGIRKGVVRFFNVKNAPPQRGRPKVAETLSLEEMVSEFVGEATYSSGISWADPEED